MKKYSLICILSIFISAFVSCGNSVKVSSLQFGDSSLIALSPAAVNAMVPENTEDGGMFFKFSEEQYALVRSLYNEKGLKAAKFLLDSNGEMSQSFQAGLLYSDDFDDDGKILSELDRRPEVKGSFAKTKSDKVELILVSRKIPRGFYVVADAKVSVASFDFARPQLGFDLSSEVPVFAFGYDGGSLPSDYSQYDFAQMQELFPAVNSTEGVMPYIELGFKKPDSYGDQVDQAFVSVQYGSDRFTVNQSPIQQKLVLQTSAFTSKNVILKVDENADLVNCIMMKENKTSMGSEKVIEPFATDLGFILEWPKKNWRSKDYELFQWNLFPEVLFFDFANYDVQSLFFTRMAYFVEKEGYKGTLQSDQFCMTHHGYNAHDYKAVDMARFFTKAVEENFSLNEQELTLRSILLHNKIIISQSDGTFKAGNGAVISISRESPRDTRVQLMAHESWHGIFFSSEEFRNFIDGEFNAFCPVCWKFLEIYFKTQPGLNYDITDDYLMKNEFMSYLMQKSVYGTRDYWRTRADWNSVNAYSPSQAVHVRSNNAADIKDATQRMSDWVFEKYGLQAGKAWLCTRK